MDKTCQNTKCTNLSATRIATLNRILDKTVGHPLQIHLKALTLL